VAGSDTRRRLTLRPSPSSQAAVRSGRPQDGSWRADALASSRHTRLLDELRRPLDLHDLERAREVCGAAARLFLQDFAPTLILLPVPERQRLQAVTAYALTLFDFVRQAGLEGERLAAINRWEFELESALDAQPTGQPVFLLLADLERQIPWSREAFNRLHAIARRRCAVTRPPDRAAAERSATDLGATFARLMLGSEPAPAVVAFAAGLVRLRSLLDLGEDLRRHRTQLPVTEVPEARAVSPAEFRATLAAAIAAEGRRLAAAFDTDGVVAALPGRLGAAIRYSGLAAARLRDRLVRLREDAVDAPPRLGIWERLILLGKTRWRRS
jgi:phytoene/squalene synthetase